MEHNAVIRHCAIARVKLGSMPDLIQKSVYLLVLSQFLEIVGDYDREYSPLFHVLIQ